MKIQIIGNGAFGSFLNELLSPHFEICKEADSVILAVPFSAYNEVAQANKGKHLINVCSVQKPSTDICLKHSDRVTSIHPLFGRRTPENKRTSIFTYSSTIENDTWQSGSIEWDFVKKFKSVSEIWNFQLVNGKHIAFTPESHDILMAKTHLAAVMGAKQLQVFVDRAKDIPDHLIPNSFRLLREFVKTLEDMPSGTLDSIMSNAYY